MTLITYRRCNESNQYGKSVAGRSEGSYRSSRVAPQAASDTQKAPSQWEERAGRPESVSGNLVLPQQSWTESRFARLFIPKCEPYWADPRVHYLLFPAEKNGRTSQGTQRWRCTNCDPSTIFKRPDTTAGNELTAFVGWPSSKRKQAGYAITSARRRTAWYLNVHPHLNPTGEVFDAFQGHVIYLRPGLCYLATIADGHVSGWQWCDQEKPSPGPHCSSTCPNLMSWSGMAAPSY